MTGFGASVLAASVMVIPAGAGTFSPLTITPLGWNVVGLDQNNTDLGPNQFPIGGRVCNNDIEPLTDVVATFGFTGVNPAISLAGPNQVTIGTLAPESCADAWFTVQVERAPASLNTARPFLISVDSAETGSTSTPVGDEIYVSPMDPEPGLVLTLTEMPDGEIKVGDEVQFVFKGDTTITYDQLLTAMVLPPDLFSVKSVGILYDTPADPYSKDQFYADGCGWVTDPLSVDYLSCLGPEGVPGGVAGGKFSVQVTAEAISDGTGSISNFIMVHSEGAIFYNGDYAENSVTEITVAPPVADIYLDKVFVGDTDVNDNGILDAGDTLDWYVVATNNGEADLGTTVIDDDLTGDTQSCLDLAVGATCEMETSYTLTEDDMTTGTVTNLASVTATYGETEVTAEAVSVIDLNNLPAPGDASVYLDKIYMGFSDDNTDGQISEGETVGWSLAAFNNGDVTLTDATIDDPLTGDTYSCGVLVPGDYCYAEVDYPATAEDAAAVTITNEATVTAQSPGGERQASDTDIRLIAEPGDAEVDGISLDKTLAMHDDANNNGDVDAGEILTWDVTAINTGNVSLTDVVIDDPLTGDTYSCGVLVPGEPCTIETSYIVTEDDVTARSVTNDAAVGATSPLGDVTAVAADTQEVGPNPIGLIKAFTSHTDTNDNDVVDAGEKLNWTVTATNNTDVDMTDVTVADPMTGDSKVCPTLAPGATCVLETDYVVLEVDVTAKAVTNTATVTGEIGDETVSNDATATYDFPTPGSDAVTGGGLFWFLAIGTVLGLSGWFASRRKPIIPAE